MSEHFVAHLKVEKVVKPERSSSGVLVQKPDREVSEVTSFTIKSDDLEGLMLKLGKHIAIIDEE